MSAIGIDLGTTNSCVAVFRNGRSEIIANDLGNRVTPSYVSFPENERLVGEAAKEEATEYFENTLYQIKRLIGRTYDDPSVQADMKLWGFTVINDDNKPKISVVHGHKRNVFSPEQISAMVLEYMKNAAEAFLGETVTDAVITVPAYFNDAQRKATGDAGVIAGLNVIGMINEPTAAAVAYGLDRLSENERNVLIFDLGGGTFDVTIVKIKGHKFDVKATGGDTHLGGEDFDNILVEYFVSEFKKQHGDDISENKRALHRLRVACEAAKRKLSSSTNAKVQVDALHGGYDFRSSISRAKFENLNHNFFERVLDTVKNTLSDSGLKRENIDDVVLVGGSTRIPKIQEMLEKYFDNIELKRTINLDEAVAYGAAVYASALGSIKDPVLKEFALEDVSPLSIGIQNHGGTMAFAIPRNTKIPTKVWRTWYTTEDNQERGTLKIYEGERTLAKDNHFLGEFTISGIPPAPRSEGKIEVVLEISTSGILHVKAIEEITENSSEITIARDKGRLSKSEIKRMVQEAEKFRKKDQELKQRSDARNELEDYAYSVKDGLDQKHLTRQQRESIMSKVTEILQWLDINKIEPPEMSELEARKREFERAVE
uniref:heat shock 70 kDa protein cognate 4-like n=1 Tax=Styela clava TaxID=7725 RepID=UPI00193A0214|nr:heat shock 70 kDa protein cognate 4-like [Styela clava]